MGHVAEETIGRYWVSTVRLAIEHPGGMWFETYIFPQRDGEVTDWIEVYGERYATEGVARAGHVRIAQALRDGTLETWDGGKLVADDRDLRRSAAAISDDTARGEAHLEHGHTEL